MKKKRDRRRAVRETAVIGVSAALCMILSYVEFLLPPIYAALPAVKPGIANVVIVFALYRMSGGRAAILATIKVLLSALLFGSFVSLAYSAAGAILSLMTMVIMKRTGLFSSIGVSVSGGVAHNVGQILTAIAILGIPEVAYYLPILLISGTLSGMLVGFCGGVAVSRIKLDHDSQGKDF